MVISFVFALPMYGVMVYNMFHDIEAGGTGFSTNTSTSQELLTIITTVIYTIGAYLMYCLPFIAIAFQYFNLVEEKEATGLMQKIDTIGTIDESSTDPDEDY